MRLSRADSTQKGQNAWILNTIKPSNTRLNTAMAVVSNARPHQLRLLSSPRASPGSTRGKTAIKRTAR